MQDKKPPRRLTAASVEPVTAESQAVTATSVAQTLIPPADNRPKHHGSETRQLELIAGRVPQPIKAEVNRMAKLKAWTPSKTVGWLVEQALARTIAEQFGVMIRQTIEASVREEFRIYSNRMGKLTFSAYLAAEQGRIIGIDNLRAILDDPDALSKKIASSREQAWDNFKLYNYSIADIDKAVSASVPWQ